MVEPNRSKKNLTRWNALYQRRSARLALAEGWWAERSDTLNNRDPATLKGPLTRENVGTFDNGVRLSGHFANPIPDS